MQHLLCFLSLLCFFSVHRSCATSLSALQSWGTCEHNHCTKFDYLHHTASLSALQPWGNSKKYHPSSNEVNDVFAGAPFLINFSTGCLLPSLSALQSWGKQQHQIVNSYHTRAPQSLNEDVFKHSALTANLRPCNNTCYQTQPFGSYQFDNLVA